MERKTRMVQQVQVSQKSFLNQTEQAKKVSQTVALDATFAIVKKAIVDSGLKADLVSEIGGDTFLALAIKTFNKFKGCDLALLASYAISPIGWQATKQALGIKVVCSHYEFRLAGFLIAASIDYKPTIEGRKLDLACFFNPTAENVAAIKDVFFTLIDFKVKKASFNNANIGLFPKLGNFIDKSAPEALRKELKSYARDQLDLLSTAPLDQLKAKLEEDLARVFATATFKDLVEEINALRAAAKKFLEDPNSFKLNHPIDQQLSEAVNK